ncbi:MAG: DUF362 domain-containing protein [Dehalococcoidales bacterium]|nr:DUF362 domain-containing protein [Dehalococcoidales bacterium]
MNEKAVVAILRTRPETVLDDYERLFELAGVRSALDPSAPTILKDNISWHFPFPGANTTPWQLEGTILALRNAGFEKQFCVQNRTVVTNAFKGTDLNGYWPICRAHDVPVLFNFRAEDMQWVEYQPKAKMLALDRIFEGHIRIPDFFFGKNIVHLPTVKCHIYTTTTGAMKNAFGGLLNEKRHYTHTWINETLVDLLAIQREIHPGIFAVMDGTTAGNGAGPRIMDPQTKNVILASADQVAIDAVAAKMMGFDPLSLRYVRLAHEAGLGVGDPREIDIVGDVEVADQNWHFAVGRTFLSFLGWLSWYGPTRHLQKFIFHGPLANLTYPVSEFYHDYYRWPLRERRVFERWLGESPWGHLFKEYASRGHLGGKETRAGEDRTDQNLAVDTIG